MITIRCYATSDAESVGRLIADIYSQFNLSLEEGHQDGHEQGESGMRKRSIALMIVLCLSLLPLAPCWQAVTPTEGEVMSITQP